ncbi:MAG: ThiF family adenylyltransferase [Planctomycetales bacterium]|nr:ThiF family adenylyltransferase [Planctomycetales bacterium]
MSLRISDDDRYARLRLLPDLPLERLRRATLLVAGVGALGNEVAKTFALLGVGRLLLLDRDRVEASNLSRAVLFRAGDAGRPKAEVAAERLRELNPDVAAVPLVADVSGGLGLGTLRECDASLGCLDSREARLALNAASFRAGVPLVDGALGDLSGTVRVFRPPDGPCYECGLTDTDWKLLAARAPCGLVGRAVAAEGRIPTTPMAAAAVAAFEVEEALRLLRGDGDAAGTALVWNGRGPTLYRTRLPARPDCSAHETWPPARRLPVAAARATPGELLAEAAPRLGPRARLLLGREWVAAATCVACGRRDPVRRLRRTVHEEGRAAACPGCGGAREPEVVAEVGPGSPWAAETLADLGVAPYDVVRVAGEDGAAEYLCLAGDREPLLGNGANGGNGREP